MGADHAYTAPKTDGTFGLGINWSRLSKSSAPKSTGPSSSALPPFQPLTQEELATKTLRQFWNWREWRQSSPIEGIKPKRLLANYQAKWLNAKVPSGRILIHWMVFVASFGFVVNYGKNSGHLYAKHH